MVDVDKRAMNGKRLPEVLIDSALISTIASIVGIVLRVIEPGGIQTYWMAASATFAIGIGQLFETEPLGSNVTGLVSIAGERPLGDIGIGMITGGLPGGVAGIFLGALSLFGVTPRILLPVATVIFGLVLVLGTWAIVRLNDRYTAKTCEKEETRAVARAGVRIAETLEAFIGFGSIALGILGLTGLGLAPLTLTPVAMLGVGFSSLLNSTIFSGRVLSTLHCQKVPVV